MRETFGKRFTLDYRARLPIRLNFPQHDMPLNFTLLVISNALPKWLRNGEDKEVAMNIKINEIKMTPLQHFTGSGYRGTRGYFCLQC